MTKRQASRLPFSLPATSVDEDTSTVVPIEAFTVVIRASTLQSKYDGGVDGFASEWGNRTFCSDGQLVRIGIMVDTDVTAFLGELADRGLTPADDDGAVDVAVISQSGLERPCDWLQLGRHPDGFLVAWLAGTEPGELAIPPSGPPRKAGAFQLSREEARTRLKFLRIEDMVDVFVDRQTGQMLYAGRRGEVDASETHPDFPARSITELYEWGTSLVDPYLLPFKPGYADRTSPEGVEDLRRGIHLLTCVTEIEQESWNTFWILGMANRALGDHEAEYMALKRSAELRPENPNTLREFAQTCLHFGYADEAVATAWKATEADPDNAGLRCNLAVALMVKGDIAQAKRIAAAALVSEPEDEVTRNVMNLLEQIERGEKSPPESLPLPT